MPWPLYALRNRIQDVNFKVKNDTMGHVKNFGVCSSVFLVQKRLSLSLVFHSFFILFFTRFSFSKFTSPNMSFHYEFSLFHSLMVLGRLWEGSGRAGSGRSSGDSEAPGGFKKVWEGLSA